MGTKGATPTSCSSGKGRYCVVRLACVSERGAVGEDILWL